jgi:hypothetical protein
MDEILIISVDEAAGSPQGAAATGGSQRPGGPGGKPGGAAAPEGSPLVEHQARPPGARRERRRLEGPP